jgi:quinol monooxygenase YgiN
VIHVLAHVKSKPGQEIKLRAILLQLAQASRREDGVLRYELFETDKPGEFLFQEEYASADAFASHKASPHVRMAIRHAYPMMEGGLTLWEVHPL